MTTVGLRAAAKARFRLVDRALYVNAADPAVFVAEVLQEWSARPVVVAVIGPAQEQSTARVNSG